MNKNLHGQIVTSRLLSLARRFQRRNEYVRGFGPIRDLASVPIRINEIDSDPLQPPVAFLLFSGKYGYHIVLMEMNSRNFRIFSSPKELPAEENFCLSPVNMHNGNALLFKMAAGNTFVHFKWGTQHDISSLLPNRIVSWLGFISAWGGQIARSHYAETIHVLRDIFSYNIVKIDI
jgi:hypothetical protein